MATTDREQLLLELINDARLDPMGNAARYLTSAKTLDSPDPEIENALKFFNVDGALFLKQLSKLKAVSPFAWNEKLGAAARGHNDAIIEADAQAHEGLSDGGLGTRISDKGYNFSRIGENIFAFGSNGLEMHAAFMVDWGGSAATGGMQDPAGHRLNIMSGDFREVGLGVTLEDDPDTSVGPQVVTQDFGTRLDGPAVLVFGVAYKDKNKDGFYSLGEGVKKLNVALDGEAVSSASSGGYTLESKAIGAKTAVLSGGGLKKSVSVKLDLAAGDNVKLDIVNGNTLRTSESADVAGGVSTIEGLGIKGLALSAGAGNQKLIGTSAKDTLTGGSGADSFVFDTKLGQKNIDAVTDFSVKQKDHIHLDHDVFTKLGKGVLAESAFFEGTKANDNSDRVIYDADSGKLFYDVDGSGKKGAVQFALLDRDLKLDHLDFLVV